MIPVALIGMAGSGKTTVARVLAERSGCAMLDSDALIEQKLGCSISFVFATWGEKTFRKAEREVLLSLVGSSAILSLGGGAVLHADAISALKATHRIVWLDTPLSVLESRLRNDATRPLAARTRELFAARRPLYAAAADLTVLTDGKSPETLAAEIAERLC